ncbi:MAG: inositol monophosphatase family protein [Gammaproteobacteria bacterium]
MQFAHELADRSRDISSRAATQRPRVQMKSDASPVTDTDRLVEQVLREMIADRFPRHGVLGEEHGAVNEGADLVWVIDPIDGTLAFVAGVPVFGTLIGLAHENKPLLGIIDHPMTRDRWAGGPEIGATRNGEEVRTRSCPELERAYLTCSNPDFMNAAELGAFHELRGRAELNLYGASCYAYGLLASGRTDVGVDCGFDIFDMLAPAAVIQGAGGMVTDWTGKPIDLDWQGQVVACGDEDLHRQVVPVLTSAAQS